MGTIIVQDTDPGIADILHSALILENYTVHKFTRCDDELYNTVVTVKPDVVILDFDYVKNRGAIPCKVIKEAYPNLPVIAISDNNNIRSTYREFGFDDYIAKPFDLITLYEIIGRHVK